MRLLLSLAAASLALVGLRCASAKTATGAGPSPAPGRAPGSDGAERWVGAWACGPQLTETANLPPAPGLRGGTLRQALFVSLGGGTLRLRLSNAYGDGPVTMQAVHLAVYRGAGAIDASTDRALTFSGSPSVTIAAADTVLSDPLSYPLRPLRAMAVTIAFGDAPKDVTGHPGSRTTSYLAPGNVVAAPTMPPSAATTAHWYFITGIDVMADAATSAVVVLGDSITDGRGTTTDGNDRWPDDLARRLQANAATEKVSVLNLGIGGNAVRSGGIGPTAVQRFRSDVLGQSGARWLIVLEGVNDIGGAASNDVAPGLITAFGDFIALAHERGMRAYGVPILPFGGNARYDSPDHQAARQTVNDWIRTSGKFDAVIDLDQAVRDPANPNRLLPAYDTGDHLHLNPTGYRKMADAIDLALFTR